MPHKQRVLVTTLDDWEKCEQCPSPETCTGEICKLMDDRKKERIL